jgi:ribonuclease HI
MEELARLEESLWGTETRHDRAYMERVLDPASVEFGRSGRVYTRDDSLNVEADSMQAKLPLNGFAVHEISDAVALVTYVR